MISEIGSVTCPDDGPEATQDALPDGGLHWGPLGRCSDLDRELFFPAGPNRAQQLRQALELCGSCPVRHPCLEHALRAPEPFGIWGGTTPRQRGWDKHGKRCRGTDAHA